MPKKPPGKSPSPKWIIDLHGMHDAICADPNIATGIATAITSGEMHILKTVSADLSNIYPDLYEIFQNIPKKKYAPITMTATAAVAPMMEASGTNIIGSFPPAERFTAIAVARQAGAILVSSGKSLTECRSILKNCGLGTDCVIDIKQFG